MRTPSLSDASRLLVVRRAEEIYGDYREFRAILAADGRIRWEPGGVFKTMCEIDITYFPFDEQVKAFYFSVSLNQLKRGGCGCCCCTHSPPQKTSVFTDSL